MSFRVFIIGLHLPSFIPIICPFYTHHTQRHKGIFDENMFRLLQGGTPLLRVCQLVRRIGYAYSRETAPMSTNTCAVRVYMHVKCTVLYVTRSSRIDCRAATESQVPVEPSCLLTTFCNALFLTLFLSSTPRCFRHSVVDSVD